MPVQIGARYELIAGHWLPLVPEGHKCRRPHGHNYTIEIALTGTVRDDGFIIDFFDLDKAVKPLLDRCDHRMLNEIEGLENPTAEIIATWLRNRVGAQLPPGITVVHVKVWETPTCFAVSS